MSDSMRAVIYRIRKAFPSVQQLDTEVLAKWMDENEKKNLIVLDVREKEEYDVSHLPNALWVKPDEQIEQVVGKIKGNIENNEPVKVVAYCSIGYRSSSMAQKLKPEFKKLMENADIDKGSELYNLEGSCFKWANEGRMMVDCHNVKTSHCHPYRFASEKLLYSNLMAVVPTSNEKASS